MRNLKSDLCGLLLAGIMLFAFSSVFGASDQTAKEALSLFKASFPQTHTYNNGDAITKIYGAPFGSGVDPISSAEQFRTSYAHILGVEPEELHQISAFNDQLRTQQVMYDEKTGQYKFSLVYYSQYKGDIPVFRGELRLLVRNEADYPLVMAVCAVKNLGDFQPDAATLSADPLQVQKAFAANLPNMLNFSAPRTVIWAGIGTEKVAPTVGVEFIADNGQPATEKYLYVIDLNGNLLFRENKLIDVNVTGQVNGKATENFLAAHCGNEVSTPMPYARALIQGGNSAYADSNGNYNITNSGSAPVTVISVLRGHWFWVHNQSGNNDSLWQSVTPPGPANFLHNTGGAEYTTAEANGYLQANIVRDYTLKYNPTYPTIYNQTEFPVYVNDYTLYCPGNAWYDGVSITFCRAGSGYPNTAFSTVIHHEYGHHLVEKAGSGQGQYGEGMGDVMGLLITDNPGAAIGFYGDCIQPLRTANNTRQYPCNDEIHVCGTLISGCVWSTRNELAATNPTTYRNIISDLAINSMLLHTGDSIEPSITIDYLTLDDDDGNINNGTPHYTEICAGFGAHNMDCPPLSLLAFSYPNGKPQLTNPTGGTTVRVVVTGVTGIPQPGTGQLHYNTGSGWNMSIMEQVSPNVYDAVFPACSCRSNVQYYFSARTSTSITVNDPSDAPTSSFSAIAGSAIATLFSDDFSTNQGWTGLGGGGEWTISAATGGTGSDTHGGPDPSIDHSPTSDNGVLGTDNTPGTGGDYSPNLSTTYWVTSPIINCAGHGGVKLEFYRWLGVERNLYDHAYLQGYNGTSWVTLFQNGSTTINESAWSMQTYNLSSIADNRANFQLRFGIGTTDSAWQFCGWNIDDLKITSIECVVTYGTIAGIVSDIHGPVANAIVIANDGIGHIVRDTTVADGSYSISTQVGSYSVSFSHVDHVDTSRTGVVVTEGDTTTVNMQMRLRPGIIQGLVSSDFAFTHPLAGVRVAALGTVLADTTGANGRFLIPGLTPAIYDFAFTHPSYYDTIVSLVNITPGDTITLDVVMTPLCIYLLGDINGDRQLAGDDVTFGVRFFKGSGIRPPDSCYMDSTQAFLFVAGDVNGNCEFRGSDITRIVSYFKGFVDLNFCHFFPPTWTPNLIRVIPARVQDNLLPARISNPRK
jgi:hypothetical protein